MSTQPTRSEQHALTPELRRIAARWPALVALLAIGAIYLVIPRQLALGPSWSVLALVVVAALVLAFTIRRDMHLASRRVALMVIGVVTVAIAVSAGFLVGQLTIGLTNAPQLLRDAALIWVANTLIFSVWYWELDGGGPVRRHKGYTSQDFIFPQMTEENAELRDNWRPGFIDYLFLSFNTSTAFSPTDTLILSRRAKVLMMCQSLVSLVVIAVLAARAINTLPGR